MGGWWQSLLLRQSTHPNPLSYFWLLLSPPSDSIHCALFTQEAKKSHLCKIPVSGLLCHTSSAQLIGLQPATLTPRAHPPNPSRSGDITFVPLQLWLRFVRHKSLTAQSKHGRGGGKTEEGNSVIGDLDCCYQNKVGIRGGVKGCGDRRKSSAQFVRRGERHGGDYVAALFVWIPTNPFPFLFTVCLFLSFLRLMCVAGAGHQSVIVSESCTRRGFVGQEKPTDHPKAQLCN